MIKSIGTIAIYVDDQESAQEFWTQLVGFKTIREDQFSPHQFWIEVAPNENSETRIVIYSKEMMLEQRPENVCPPSIVFECENIEDFYKKLKVSGVKVGQLQRMHMGPFFEMQDNEGNSYLIRELI